MSAILEFLKSKPSQNAISSISLFVLLILKSRVKERLVETVIQIIIISCAKRQSTLMLCLHHGCFLWVG